jgi:hypothetical protein
MYARLILHVIGLRGANLMGMVCSALIQHASLPCPQMSPIVRRKTGLPIDTNTCSTIYGRLHGVKEATNFTQVPYLDIDNMFPGWAILSGLAALPAIGIYAASQQQQQQPLTASSSFASLLPESFTSILGFTSQTEAEDPLHAHLDGRIQSSGLLSSRFGMYGWPKQSFDYVIIGGGTAGLAMARRLSQDGTQSVAVIEAGGFYEIDGGNATEVPMYLFNYFLDTGYMKNPLFDWYQYTVPQPVSLQPSTIGIDER